MSNRYQQCFNALNERDEMAWIPFMMLGYPTMDKSVELIKALIDSGADALELGIPFSDPIADGKMVQIAAKKALSAGATVKGCMQALKEIRAYHADIPIGLLTYANLVYRPGAQQFYLACQQAGVDSVLVADVPVQEVAPFKAAANAHDIQSVLIAPPNADKQCLKAISELSQGYTYMVSRPGVTGDGSEVAYPVKVLNQLLEFQAAPPVLGFGISQPEHMAKAKSLGFKGAIAGSAVIRVIEDNIDGDPISPLKDYAIGMKQATLNNQP
jgi:tryptophan synthase alpha chain